MPCDLSHGALKVHQHFIQVGRVLPFNMNFLTAAHHLSPSSDVRGNWITAVAVPNLHVRVSSACKRQRWWDDRKTVKYKIVEIFNVVTHRLGAALKLQHHTFANPHVKESNWIVRIRFKKSSSSLLFRDLRFYFIFTLSHLAREMDIFFTKLKQLLASILHETQLDWNDAKSRSFLLWIIYRVVLAPRALKILSI